MKETFYFAHDYNASQDPKILNLLYELKWEGYGLYWLLIEKLAEANGKLLLTDLRGIAFSSHIELEKLNLLVSSFFLFEEDGKYFWSNRLLDHLKSRQKISNLRAKLGRLGGQATAKQLLSKSSSKINQSKGKESKGKEMKEIEFSNENCALSYKEPPKDTYQDKAKTYKKLGIPYKPPKRSDKQNTAWDTELLARFVKDKAMEMHRVEVYVNKKESSKSWSALSRAIKELGIEKAKGVAEHYLQSEKYDKFGADISTMFSDHSINMFLQKKENKYEGITL